VLALITLATAPTPCSRTGFHISKISWWTAGVKVTAWLWRSPDRRVDHQHVAGIGGVDRGLEAGGRGHVSRALAADGDGHRVD